MFQTLVNLGVFFGATWIVSKTDTKLGSVAKDIIKVSESSLALASAATHSIAESVDSITKELEPSTSNSARKAK